MPLLEHRKPKPLKNCLKTSKIDLWFDSGIKARFDEGCDRGSRSVCAESSNDGTRASA